MCSRRMRLEWMVPSRDSVQADERSVVFVEIELEQEVGDGVVLASLALCRVFWPLRG